MVLNNVRNRVLAALRDRPDGIDSETLGQTLGLTVDEVERHLLYCADYELARWTRKNGRVDVAVITERGRDYLTRQQM